jgi:hypothetical protein
VVHKIWIFVLLLDSHDRPYIHCDPALHWNLWTTTENSYIYHNFPPHGHLTFSVSAHQMTRQKNW